jgi:hypothetical protein
MKTLNTQTATGPAKLPSHLFVSSSDGNLYDTRVEAWSKLPPLRTNYRRTIRNIKSVSDLKATLRAGGFAWPGGYALYLLMDDCSPLCFDCGRKEFRRVADSIRTRTNDGWRAIGTLCMADSDLGEDTHCCNCGRTIE